MENSTTLSQNEFHSAYDESDRYAFVACSCVGNGHGILIETVPDDPDTPLEAREIMVQFWAIGGRSMTLTQRLKAILALLTRHDYHYEEIILSQKGATRLSRILEEMVAAKEEGRR
jgi:hypothetical protein